MFEQKPLLACPRVTAHVQNLDLVLIDDQPYHVADLATFVTQLQWAIAHQESRKRRNANAIAELGLLAPDDSDSGAAVGVCCSTAIDAGSAIANQVSDSVAAAGTESAGG